MRVDALLFDKDGTLFDFHHTWGPWVGQVIEELGEGDRDRGAALASALGYDLATKKYFPNSPLIACTNRQAAEYITGVLPHLDVSEIEHYLTASAQDVPLAPVVPLDVFLTGLKHRGLKLGVMTNDSEVGARAVAAITDALVGRDNQRIVVATHGGTARTIIGSYLELPIPFWSRIGGLSNAQWSILDHSPKGWLLVEHNAGSIPEPVYGEESGAVIPDSVR